MSEAIKKVSNFRLQLKNLANYILMRNLPYVLKKCMFRFIKYLIVTKAK